MVLTMLPTSWVFLKKLHERGTKMTVKELYDYCVKHNCENSLLTLDYTCNDNWYDYYNSVKKEEIKITTGEVAITINN